MALKQDLSHEKFMREQFEQSAINLLIRSEAAEARAEAAEARAADLLEQNRELSEALDIVRAERDDWKTTAENQHARLEFARVDFMRRLSVVTHLWFATRRERDKERQAVLYLGAERDEAKQKLNALKRELSEAFNSGDGAYRP